MSQAAVGTHPLTIRFTGLWASSRPEVRVVDCLHGWDSALRTAPVSLIVT